MRHFYFKLLFASFLLSAYSCTTPYQFSIVPAKIKTEKKFNLKDKTISIEVFNDLRKENPENGIFFTNPRSTKITIDPLCINSEKHYKRPIAKVLANISSIYFRHTLRFKRAISGNKHIADYYITADLKEFKAIQNKSMGAVKQKRDNFMKSLMSSTIAIPIPIGKNAILSVGVNPKKGAEVFRSMSDINIELANIKIYNSKDELLGQLDDISIANRYRYIADADCWCAYWSMEYFYKELNLILIDDTIKFLEDYNLNQG